MEFRSPDTSRPCWALHQVNDSIVLPAGSLPSFCERRTSTWQSRSVCYTAVGKMESDGAGLSGDHGLLVDTPQHHGGGVEFLHAGVKPEPQDAPVMRQSSPAPREQAASSEREGENLLSRNLTSAPKMSPLASKTLLIRTRHQYGNDLDVPAASHHHQTPQIKADQVHGCDAKAVYNQTWFENSAGEDEGVADRTFGGLLRSDVICNSCGYVSTVYEPFVNISLDVEPLGPPPPPLLRPPQNPAPAASPR